MNTFGRYQPVELVASSPRTHLWLAHDPSGREVVLKMARAAADREVIAREAEALRHVGPHPHLVALLDEAPDRSWLVTERIEGETLDRWAVGASFDDLVRAALQLVSALDHLHGRGVVHGDLKPSNVLVDARGDVRLLDLGVATLEAEAVTSFRGTLGFAAPELLEGARPDARADLYGLGALLYTAVTQRRPFEASDPAALTYLPLVSLPAPPSTFRPDLPSALGQLLLGLLARRPDQRPATLGRVREALGRVADSRPAPPVLGMLEERETLRRAVVGAADGEPRVVVVYGPAGSGRRTLVSEAVEYARREGLPYLKGAEVATAIEAIRGAPAPSVLVMRASNRAAAKLAVAVLKDRLPCLLLLHAERPIPALVPRGAIHVTPSPLRRDDAIRLARVWGAEPELADRWWRESLGLPAALLGRIRAWRREQTGEPLQERLLPAESLRILEVLRAERTLPVPELARRLELGEHALLDHCEVLFAEGLVRAANDGHSIALA